MSDSTDPPPRRSADGLPPAAWWPQPGGPEQSTPPTPPGAFAPPTGPRLGAPPMPPTPPPTTPRSRPWVIDVVSVVVVLALLGGGGYLGLKVLGDSGPDHPKTWDPRVAAIAHFVEGARDLVYKHPVYVDFLSTAEYSAITRQSNGKLDAQARKEYEQGAGELRALGLASGKLDLAAASEDVADEGTLAFYDPISERVRVRGTGMSPGLEVTLAHELTHVLQDQYFDLERVQKLEDPGASGALRALAEGDATRIEDEYKTKELSKKDQAAADKQLEGDVGQGGEKPLSDVPDALVALFAAPYLFGEPFVQAIAADGNAAIDKAFRDPPVSEEQVFDVLQYLERDNPNDVAEVKPRKGDKVRDSGQLGIVTWYLLLAARIDPHDALAAADGWGGDAYVQVDRKGTTCVDARFKGDTPHDTDQMAAALDAWRKAMPTGPSVVRDGQLVELHACDPGTKVNVTPKTSPLDALSLPSVREYLVADALSVFDPPVARCLANRVVTRLSIAVLADPPPGFVERSLPKIIRAAREACA